MEFTEDPGCNYGQMRSSAVLHEAQLKQLRASLIQKPAEPPADSSLLFSALLRTAAHPPLPQPHRALAVDALSAWLIRSASSPRLQGPLGTPAPPWDALAAIVFAHFDDAQSGLSKALKDLLGNVLAAVPHGSSAAFTASLAERVLRGIRTGAGGKVGYYVLEVVVKKRVVSAAWALARYRALGAEGEGEGGGLVADMLACVSDRTLSPAIGKALVGLLAARRQEMAREGHAEGWMALWEGPLRAALGRGVLRANVQVYVLPGLFKLSPECFAALVESLGLARYGAGAAVQGGGGELAALLCCLKVGKDLGLVEEIQHPHKLCLPPALVAPLLSHAHPHIRLAALALLTHTPTLTRPLPATTFSALRAALPPLHAEPDAEVRNAVITALRSLIERLGSSAYALEKELLGIQKRAKAADTARAAALHAQIEDVRVFMQWYLRFLQSLLQPGSGYQRVVTALRVLGVLARAGVDREVAVEGRKGAVMWPGCFGGLRLFEGGMERGLVEALFNPFDDVRAAAAGVLRLAPGAGFGGGVGGVLERGVAVMNAGGRAGDADGVARVLEMWWELAERGAGGGGEVWGVPVEGRGGLAVVRWVLRVLGERYLCVARADFQRAVRERPVHGLLAGLRLILERKGVYAAGRPDEWRAVHTHVFAACVEIWGITKGVLCEASPEGFMPDLAGEEEDEDLNTQTVVSYSWRAVKEASTLLGTILSTAPYSTAPDSILTPDAFSSGGALLLSQLSSIRHRGAFSAVSPSFITLCTRLFKSPSPDLQALPQRWLAQNTTLIISKSNAITRRSAGLPYLIIGILIAETAPDRPLLHATFAQLAELASLPPPPPSTATQQQQGEKTDLPQVHALNCIKFLFTDSRLAAPAAAHVGRALELAVAAFGSDAWAVRNCGIMLFTTLLNRLFGTRRSRNEYGGGGMDARVFFERYPLLRGVLLRGLGEKVGVLEEEEEEEGQGQGVEMVYPALSLLARLEYAPGYEGEMEEFGRLVAVCMRSRVWKVREMAAKAYATLVGPGEQVAGVAERLLAETRRGRMNLVHGNLCAVRVLLERGVGSAVLASVWRSLGSVFTVLVGDNKCAVTKALYLQILTDHAISAGLIEQERDPWLELVNGSAEKTKTDISTSDEAISSLRTSILSYSNHSTTALSEFAHASTVGRSLLKEQLTRFMLTKALLQPTSPHRRVLNILHLLSSTDEEVALSTATHLLTTPTPLPLTPAEATALDTALWHLISSHPWGQLRVAALKLIPRYSTPETHLEQRWRLLLDLVAAPPSEPCKDAALAALGQLTAKIWLRWQGVEGGGLWAVWCLDSLVVELRAAGNEEMPYPAREAALEAVKALEPVLALGLGGMVGWREGKEGMRGVFFALYDLLNDDDEDIRDGAAGLACRVLGGEGVPPLTPLKAGEALAAAMGREFGGGAGFVGDVVGRLMVDGAGDVGSVLERALGADTILFAREKQNLFVDRVGEAERWAAVLGGCDGEESVEARRDFVFWVMAGLVALGTKVKELGMEGALGWIGNEDVFVVGVKVLEGLKAVKVWFGRDDVEDAVWERVEGAGRVLLEELKSAGGHELWVRRLEEVL